MTDPHTKLDALVDKAEAKFLSRYWVPTLATLLALVAGFGFKQVMSKLDDIAKTGAETAAKVEATATEVNEVKTDVIVLKTRLDGQVIENVADNRRRIEELEKQVRVLERHVQVR